MRMVDADEVMRDAKHISAFRHNLAGLSDLAIALSGGHTIEAKHMKWISVEERLPDEDGHYIVFEVWPYGNIISLAFYAPKYNGFEEHLNGRAVWYKYDSEVGDFEVTDVTHWMPLPEPPETEEST